MAHQSRMSKQTGENRPIRAVRPAALAWVDQAPFYQAGLAGYSDGPMRRIARRHGCPYCVSEALLDRLLLNGGRGLRPARLTDDDHPIAGQLIGSQPDEMASAAKWLVARGFDVVDVNLACPVKKIRRRQRGGHLLAMPEKAVAILAAVAEAVGAQVPVTVKLRRGYDGSDESREAFDRILTAAIELGYAAATVHARTVRQKYIGPAEWSSLAELTRRYRRALDGGFLLFGSGDVDSPQAIFRMIEQTGVSGASVARGGIGNPWIFHQARQHMAGQPVTAPSLDEQRAVLAEHFELSVAWHSEALAGRLMRKFGIRFARHHPDGEQVARAFVAVENLDDWRAVLERFYPRRTPVSIESYGSSNPCFT